jgi:hypothetical protein
MKTCSLDFFMEAVKPWMDRDYIRSAHLDTNGNFVLNFSDGVRNVYRIEDCSRDRLDKILADFRKKGIDVI